MKKMKYLIFLLVIMSCTENFNLDLESDNYNIVIEGWITNCEGPYRIIVSQTTTKNVNNYNMGIDNYELIKDAVVIISDDNGMVDTLVSNYYYEYDYDPLHDKIYVVDSIADGTYKTSKIKGEPYHTYYLKVIHNNSIYTAEAYMPYAPRIDSLKYSKYYNAVKHEWRYVPLISFAEPQGEKNYYMFRFIDGGEGSSVSDISVFSDYDPWGVSIFSDEYMNEYVNSLNVGEGTSVHYWRDAYIWLLPGDSVRIIMHSITEEAFRFYEALINQFKDDGGVFKPSPASPPSNISGNALGFFGASAVSEIKGIVK
jgi:hypothetical protein